MRGNSLLYWAMLHKEHKKFHLMELARRQFPRMSNFPTNDGQRRASLLDPPEPQ
jgi:hypothetical protein